MDSRIRLDEPSAALTKGHVVTLACRVPRLLPEFVHRHVTGAVQRGCTTQEFGGPHDVSGIALSNRGCVRGVLRVDSIEFESAHWLRPVSAVKFAASISLLHQSAPERPTL